MEWLVLVLMVLAGYLALIAGRTWDESGELTEGQSRLVRRFRWLKGWHFLAALAVGLMLASPAQVAMALLAFVAVVAYLAAWVREFVFLMGLRDDDFPGRFDKPIWAFVLIATGPLGLWAFRSFRAACWSPVVGVDESAHRRSARPSASGDLA